MIPAATLTNLRDLAETALVDSASIQRLAQVSDGAGGYDDTYAPSSVVPCRVSRRGLQPNETLIAARLGTRTAFTVYLPYDADVRESDRLVVTPADPAFAVQTYEVAGVIGPVTDMAMLRLVCARVG